MRLEDVGDEPVRGVVVSERERSVGGGANARVGHLALVLDPVGTVLPCTAVGEGVSFRDGEQGRERAAVPSVVARVAVEEHCQVEDGVEVRDLAPESSRESPADRLDPVRDVVCARRLSRARGRGSKRHALGLRTTPQQPLIRSGPRFVSRILGFSMTVPGICGYVLRGM